MDESRRVALVTGGAGGLGSAIARRFVEDGDIVVLVDRDEAAAEKLAAELTAAGGRAQGRGADIASDEGNRALVDGVRAEFGRLDVLVNNAGIGQTSPYGSVSHEEWRRVLDVNLWGAASLCQAATEIWREQGGGSVVNMSSRTWVAGGPIAYASSKAGIVGLTRALAVELGPLNVRVNAVAPSTVLTPLVGRGLDEARYAEHVARNRRLSLLPRLAVEEDVADAVAFLASARASFVTGEVLHVCGGAQLAASGYQG